MSTHPIQYEQLIKYVLGELGPAESDLVARHAETCDECARTVARLEQVRFILHEGDMPPVPYRTYARANVIYARYHPARSKWWHWGFGQQPDSHPTRQGGLPEGRS